MAFKNCIIAAGMLLSFSACSTTSEEPVVYSYPRHQLPAEPRYGTTAWVQPPTVVPNNVDQSGFSEGEAPLLRPADGPPRAASPTLPKASARRY